MARRLRGDHLSPKGVSRYFLRGMPQSRACGYAAAMAFDNISERSSWFRGAVGAIDCNRSYPPSYLEPINPACTLPREKE
jgi:hypothetical protein